MTYPELSALTAVMTHRFVGDMIVDGRAEAYSFKSSMSEKREEKAWLQMGDGGSASGSAPACSSASSSAVEGEVAREGHVLYAMISSMNEVYPDYDFREARMTDFNRYSSLSEATAVLRSTLADLSAEEARRPQLPSELDTAAALSMVTVVPEGVPPPPAPPPLALAPNASGSRKRSRSGSVVAAGSGEEDARHSSKLLSRLQRGGYGGSFMEALLTILDDVLHLSSCDVYSYAPGEEEAHPLAPGSLWYMTMLFVNTRLKRLVLLSVRAASQWSARAALTAARSRSISMVSPSNDSAPLSALREDGAHTAQESGEEEDRASSAPPDAGEPSDASPRPLKRGRDMRMPLC